MTAKWGRDVLYICMQFDYLMSLSNLDGLSYDCIMLEFLSQERSSLFFRGKCKTKPDWYGCKIGPADSYMSATVESARKQPNEIPKLMAAISSV